MLGADPSADLLHLKERRLRVRGVHPGTTPTTPSPSVPEGVDRGLAMVHSEGHYLVEDLRLVVALGAPGNGGAGLPGLLLRSLELSVHPPLE